MYLLCKCVHAFPVEGAICKTPDPAKYASKEENINNGCSVLFDEALKSRAAYAVEKKRLAAEKAAALKQGDEIR